MLNSYFNFSKWMKLPESKERILVSSFGKVTYFGETVKSYRNADGKLCVDLEWRGQYRSYEVALLMLICFKPLSVDLEELINTPVGFKDGDEGHLHPKNLIWLFPPKIEVKPGQYRIPYFSRFTIDEEGVVRDTKLKDRVINPSEARGYRRFNLKPDFGPRVVVSRHRITAMVFLGYPANLGSLHVNHKDGIPGSDHYNNLEWATASENIKHAIENNLSRINKRVRCLNTETGEETIFSSMNKCGKELGISPDRLSKSLSFSVPIFMKNRYELTYADKRSEERNSNLKPVFVRNAKTGEVTHYKSLSECSSDIGLSIAIIETRLLKPKDYILDDYLQFKLDENEPWYEHEDVEQAVLLNSWERIVQVKDLSGKVVEFESQRTLSKHLGLCDATIHNLIKSGKQLYKHEDQLLWIKLKRDQSEWEKVDDPNLALINLGRGRPIVVTDVTTGIEKMYASSLDLCKETGISPTLLNYRLTSNGERIYDGRFKYRYLVGVARAPFSRKAKRKPL